MHQEWAWPSAAAAAVWDGCQTPLVLVDRSGNVRAVNEAFARTSGHPRAEGGVIPVWEILPIQVGIAALAMAEPSVTDSISVPEQVVLDADGLPHRLFWSLRRVELGDPPAPFLLVTGVDITSERHTQARLRDMAERDPLTGLPNRVVVRRALAAMLHPVSGEGALIVFCDIDRFKAVNDRWGHSVGDQVLRTTAIRLQQAVGADGVVGRLGGDEFVLLLPRTRALDAGLLVEDVRKATSLPIDVGRDALRIDMSLGVRLAEAGGDPERALDEADRAMYRHKRAGSPAAQAPRRLPWRRAQ